MNIYKQDEPDEKYLFLDWEEVINLEADVDGITIRLLAHHPLVEDHE